MGCIIERRALQKPTMMGRIFLQHANGFEGLAADRGGDYATMQSLLRTMRFVRE